VSTTVEALGFALDALQAQSAAIANNVANVDTPGYIQENVSFETSLASALANGGAASVTVTASPNPVGLNGNNVSLAQQLTEATTNAMDYQAVSNQLTTYFQILSGSMGGQF
jgi:flagellar basal-body rod protein FlgB